MNTPAPPRVSLSAAVRADHPRPVRSGGFTLIEVVIVLAVITILVGAATPMANLLVDSSRRDDVGRELVDLSRALEDFYFDRGAMPASLSAPGFFGTYLVGGVDGTSVRDAWGGNVDYRYSLSSSPDVATVWSRGLNGQDDGASGDDIVVSVPGSVPGNAKTRQRMRVIVEVMANFLESGGAITGTWSIDRVNMGLGIQYANDGFGTAFTLDALTLVLRSAGADRTAVTGDDLTN